MKLVVQSIENAGELDRERVVLRAKADIDLSEYGILACTFSDDGVPFAGMAKLGYWFPAQDVKRNDLVIFYTKAGKRAEKKIDGSRTSHFFYCGKVQPVWTSVIKPVAIYTSEWDYLTQDDATLEPVSQPKPPKGV